jgi:hypothetical protein
LGIWDGIWKHDIDDIRLAIRRNIIGGAEHDMV